MEELKAYWSKYLSGAIGGAVLVLILGFAVGPLTTNGSAVDLASAAASDRDVAYCAAHAQRLTESGDVSAPTNAEERIGLARMSLAELLPDEETSDNAVRGCIQALPGAGPSSNDLFWVDG